MATTILVNPHTRLAKLCRDLAAATGDSRFAAAAAILTSGKRIAGRSGRRAIDDRTALQYATILLSTGMARSANRACLMAAQLHAPSHQVDTMRDRLRRKLRRK